MGVKMSIAEFDDFMVSYAGQEAREAIFFI
jgi:hypothetical protein